MKSERHCYGVAFERNNVVRADISSLISILLSLSLSLFLSLSLSLRFSLHAFQIECNAVVYWNVWLGLAWLAGCLTIDVIHSHAQRNFTISLLNILLISVYWSENSKRLAGKMLSKIIEN